MLKKMEDELQAEVSAAFEFAEASPFPYSDKAFAGLFADRSQ